MRRLTLALILISIILFGLMPTPAQALTYPQLIIAAGPERYYRLGETSGGTAFDQMYGVNATYASTTLNQTGAIYDGDPSVLFSGATQSGSVTSTGIGLVNRSFACEIWFLIQPGSTTGASKYLCRFAAGSEAWNATINYTTAAGYYLSIAHGATTLTVTTSITTDTWHYYCIQYNKLSGQIEIYLNASLVGVVNDAGFTTAGANLIINAINLNMPLRLDELAFYGRTLTVGEMQLHKATGAAAYNTPTPTITYTPSITFTPTDTPTPTVTPTLTPGWDYEIPLPSGRTAAVRMEATAGDITVVMFIVFAVAIMLLTVYLRRRSNGS